MTSRQTAAICTTILLAAAANLAGGFVIQLYFEGRRATANEPFAGFQPAGLFSEPRLGDDADRPELSRFDGEDGPELMPLPAIPDDEDRVSPGIIGDGVGQPADSRVGRRFSPREFPRPERAAPIQPRPLIDDAAIVGIIDQELPDAGAEEREVWLKQLRGLGLGEMRTLLQMRRRFGSEIRRPSDLESSPVVAPLPAARE